MKTTNLALTNPQTGTKLLEALGLPKGTNSVEIRFAPNDLVIVTSTQSATKDQLRALAGTLLAMAGDSDPSMEVLPEPPEDVDVILKTGF